jgi:hypothetical protein
MRSGYENGYEVITLSERALLATPVSLPNRPSPTESG